MNPKSFVFLLGCSLLLVPGWNSVRAESTSSETEVRDAKLLGQVRLSPIEPVRGLFVQVDSGGSCCQMLEEQKIWATPELELDLVDGQSYRFDGIGVFVEPEDGAVDAYYGLFPQEPVVFRDRVADFSFERSLRPVEVTFQGAGYAPKLSIEATSRAGDLEFVSYREWEWQPLHRSSRTIWVLEGVDQQLKIDAMLGIQDSVLDDEWMKVSRELTVGSNQDVVSVELLPTDKFSLRVRVDGASVPWTNAVVELQQPTRTSSHVLNREYDGWTVISVDRNESRSYPIRPTIHFEDGSATTLAQQDVTVPGESRLVELGLELAPQEVLVSMDASFDLEKLRISVSQGTQEADARATKEVPVVADISESARREAQATLQLPQGEWQLGGLSVSRNNVLWTSNYQAWSSSTPMLTSGSQEPFDFGEVGDLVSADLRFVRQEDNHLHWSSPRLDPFRAIRGSLVEPGYDLRGRYFDSIHKLGTQGKIVGRAGHRYVFSLEKSAGEQVEEPVEVTLGCAQPVSQGRAFFAGLALAPSGRCNRVEIMYPGAESAGTMVLNRMPTAPTPPVGYLVWPGKGYNSRSFDVETNLSFSPDTTARVCMQYDPERLEQENLSVADLMMAHALDFDLNVREHGCDRSNRYLSMGWCAMPKVEPQELEFLLGGESACAWVCGIAKANSLDHIALLSPHPTQVPGVHCRRSDMYAQSEHGWRGVEAPAHLKAANLAGYEKGWEFASEVFKKTGGDRQAVLEKMADYARGLLDLEFSDPVEICRLRGQLRGYYELFLFGP